ncbi:MAG: DUF554 domain-containing protein [Clostridia bacterium]|nr:DUF554 domain-containing protein [Clostridia bacterium]
MLGVLVNTAAVIAGSTIGLLFKKIIPRKCADFVMTALALCVIYIGISGALKGDDVLVVIISMVIGSIIGFALKLDDHINNLGNRLQDRFGGQSLAEGFVTASLLFCVGAMTIVGSLQAGLTGDNTMLFTKSSLDFISSIIFASSLGIGVMLSAAFVLVFQGLIVVLAQFLSPVLTDVIIANMTCVGSLLIIAIGLNMLKVTNIKVMDMVPAIFIPIAFILF